MFDERRNNNFDAIRFFLATLVIASHAYPLLEGNNAREPLMRISGGQATGGEIAVNGFFILSGFLIVQSWERSRGLARFFRKRALRIYPGFIVAVMFGSLIVAPQIATSSVEYWQEFSATRLLATTINFNPRLPRVFSDLPIPAVNGSLWSIRYEVVCYVVLAGAGWLGLFRYRRVVLGVFMLVMATFVAQSLFHVKIPGGSLAWLYCDPEHWPRLGSCFLSGTLLYLYRDRIAYTPRWFAISVMVLTFCTVFPQFKLLPLAIPLFGSYVLFYFAYLPIPRLHSFARHGDFSYGIYLYAFPIQQLLVHHFGNELSPTTLFLAAFPPTALLAAVSWYLLEKPCLKNNVKAQPRQASKVASRSETSGCKVPAVNSLMSASAMR